MGVGQNCPKNPANIALSSQKGLLINGEKSPHVGAMNEFFFAALSFGLAAGLKPGPLGIVVIQHTLSRGLPSGVRASLAPLVTDGPIIMAAWWLLSQFKSLHLCAAALSLVGGLY
jgi:threonine/homoserine/homoserine lactone efflux protein